MGVPRFRVTAMEQICASLPKYNPIVEELAVRVEVRGEPAIRFAVSVHQGFRRAVDWITGADGAMDEGPCQAQKLRTCLAQTTSTSQLGCHLTRIWWTMRSRMSWSSCVDCRFNMRCQRELPERIWTDTQWHLMDIHKRRVTQHVHSSVWLSKNPFV